MLRWTRFGLFALFLLLAACGSNQQTTAPSGSTSGMDHAMTAVEAPTAVTAMPTAGTMAGMDNTAMPTTSATAGTMGGMDHSATPDMAMGTSNAPYDALFIDSMIMHHQGAITMANQALTAAEHPELKQLAQGIVKAQQSEIAQMQGWRKAWYPDLAPTKGMDMDMGTMMIADDPSTPFDQRFIEAMIPHHQGATTMAKDALQKAEHPEIKTLAQNIIAAQDAEITQMQQWQQTWFK